MSRPATQKLEAIRPLTQRLEAILPVGDGGGAPGARMPTSRYEMARRAAIGAYVAICLASAAWAFAGGSSDNALGARVGVGQTNEGTTFIAVRNDSAFAWHDVRVEADGRFVARFDLIEPKANVDVRLRSMSNVYRLPRPTGLFLWESAATAAPPAPHAPPGYVPDRIRVVCEEGAHELDVEL